MALVENGTLTKPIGSAVQVETLPEVYPPRGFLEDDATWAARVAAWGARTRTITFVTDDGTLMGVRETTAPIAFNATAADIETALLAGTVLAAGDVEVTGSGKRFTYSFSGAYANRPIRLMYNTLDGVDGKNTYFEMIQEGVSQAGQQAVKQAITEDALGFNITDLANENAPQQYDIGDARRYNADGTPKRSQR